MNRRKFIGTTVAAVAGASLSKAVQTRDTDFIYACGYRSHFDGKKQLTVRDECFIPHPSFKIEKGVRPKVKTLFNGKELPKDWLCTEANVNEGWISIMSHKSIGDVRKYGKVQILLRSDK
jgi:hypothetical protein